ncbi:hypothetical protein [Microbacterium testaceum]|uniref:hypothetical protein n=1 Tax=Microbacterium testaceum TaxID=2033 RepID=UPI0022E87384|nr:hypothetical protein [Microbacterium testaceum]
MTTLMAPTKVATDALTDLVHTARSRGWEAKRAGLTHTAYALMRLAADLDAVRTRLVEDGPDYLDAAWAFIDAGRRMITENIAKLDREVADRARS